MGERMADFEVRKSGLLVPFRALPGEHDYEGTLGEESVNFLDQMQRAGFSIMHDLPNTPPDKHNSPYSSTSTHAIHIGRIDAIQLARAGDLEAKDLDNYQKLVSSGDAGPDIKLEKEALLKKAFENFDNHGSPERKEAFTEWCEEESAWLEPYATYKILSSYAENEGKKWQDWRTGKRFSPKLVEHISTKHPKELLETFYMQWVADEQTQNFLDEAEKRGIEVWGDLPFYVGEGEVWTHPEIFNLDSQGGQLSRGGAAPSPTSATGQIWGNATYKYSPNQPGRNAKLIDWWTERLERASKTNRGKVRLDHFIGFAEPYIIDKKSETALNGWRAAGIGHELFSRLVEIHGEDLPFYPEDLGAMTEKTPELRDKFGLHKNTIAVRGITRDIKTREYSRSQHNPDNYDAQTVSMSSNHDSPPLVQAMDTTRQKHANEFDAFLGALGKHFPDRKIDSHTPSSELASLEIERVTRSLAGHAFIGIWDALQLGAEGRYNVPGKVLDTNWSWRMSPDDVRNFEGRIPKLRELNQSSRRQSPEAN